MINMEHKSIQVISIDKENKLYTCNDGIEYPLMEGCEYFTIEELQNFIDNAKDTTINILKNNTYKDNGKNLGIKELSYYFHNVLLKDEQYSWLKEQNTKVMKQAIRQMLVAYKNFFTLHKGFPKFKSKKDYR